MDNKVMELTNVAKEILKVYDQRKSDKKTNIMLQQRDNYMNRSSSDNTKVNTANN